MAKKKKLLDCNGLEDYLMSFSTSKWKESHNRRTLFEAYNQLKINLRETQEDVVSGAMATGIRDSISKLEKDILELQNDKSAVETIINNFLKDEHIIFLNDHGPEHIKKVIERAFIILKYANEPLSEFETFVLLCAIQIHDIGNVLGRIQHEMKLHQIFDDKCKDIIIDTAEKRLIRSIAMSHGGKAMDGSKDTISSLCCCEPILGCNIRTRFLASILRFADELADDSTRANRQALNLNIVGIDSEIYHEYSTVLHTVSIIEDAENHDYCVKLVYELEAKQLAKTYNINGMKKYLLDEIYDRTLKMEQERRYCMKFMQPYVFINRINVTINVYGSFAQPLSKISYELEDTAYPEQPMIGGIKNINSDIPSGEEELNIIRSKGEEI